MFVRIYTGLILSIILSAICCYLVFETVNQVRREAHAESIFTGTFELIQRGLDRHDGARKAQWLSAVSSLVGSPISILGKDTSGLSSRQLNHLTNKGIFVEIHGQVVKVFSHYNASELIVGEFNKVSEAHIRIAAYLLLNEIGRLDYQKQNEHIETLKELFRFPIQLISNTQLDLDRQQTRRLLRGDVVVTLESDDRSAESIFAFAPIDNNLYLKLGPIPVFNTTPFSVLLSLLLLTVLITAGTAYFLVSRLERRLEKVDIVVREFGKGEMSRRVDDHGQDSIGHLALTVNGMADKIVSLIQKQKELTQAVSHELRTPIARLKFRLSMLLEDSSAQSRESRVSGMNRDLDELNALVDEILTYQKLDYADAELTFQPVDLYELLIEIQEELEEVYPSIRFNVVAPQNDVSIIADQRLIHRLLKNLIDNAAKYGNSQVDITLDGISSDSKNQKQRNTLRLNVEDDGPGIDAAFTDKLFRPFSRLEASRSKQTGGYGLGLAIAYRIVQLHKGTIRVAKSELGGAKFQLTLPFKSRSIANPSSDQTTRLEGAP